MKNLQDKIQQLKQASEAQVNEKQTQQASLEFINPTELVDLPSKGKFYPEGHPLKNKEYVEIKQMTAREEDILTNKSLIKKGIVVDRLIESLLVDKKISVTSLYVGDKNAIMVAARIAAYGSSYEVSVNCTECGGKNLLPIDLTKITSFNAQTILKENAVNNFVNSEQLQNGNILIQLPKTGWVVECKLMDGMDERRILDILESKKKFDVNPELSITEQLKLIIVSIDTVRDRNVVFSAIDSMPAFDAKHLRKVYQKMIPNVRIEEKYACSSCSEEQEVEVPFTQEFFWPK